MSDEEQDEFEEHMRQKPFGYEDEEWAAQFVPF